MLSTRIHLPLLCCLIAGLALCGCAVHSNVGDQGQYGLDQAALFGKQVSEFSLPDGTGASIRLLNGKYSVKFQNYSRVVDIDNAATLKFRSAQLVDGYMLVVLDKSEPYCPSKLHLLALRGKETRAWEVGNCKAAPEITISPDSATFDIPEGRTATHYQFSAGQLRYAEVPYRSQLSEAVSFDAPAAPAASTTATTPAVPPTASRAPAAPTPGVAAGAGAASAFDNTSDASNASTHSKPADKKPAAGHVSASAPPAPTSALVFKSKTPTTIYLDK